MARGRQRDSAQGRPKTVTTVDELVRHLREAGAKRVYLSKKEVFQDGQISMIATVDPQRGGNEEREEADSETLAEIIGHYSGECQNDGFERKQVASVFEALGDRVLIASRVWTVDWTVRAAYTDPPVHLTTLYDRDVEFKQGDGFNLRNVLFVYEQYCESDSSPSGHWAATRHADPHDTYW